MASWFAYCDRYSADNCKTGNFEAPNRMSSRLTNFYSKRQDKYQQLTRHHTSKLAMHGSITDVSTFHPDWLEFALDDNYAVRMLCGGGAHDAYIPLPDDALDCAIDHVRGDYVIVGTLERRSESICVLAAFLGIPSKPVSSGINHAKLRGPATHTNSVSSEFQVAFQRYMRLDNKLYESAQQSFSEALRHYPQCQQLDK